MGVTQSETAFVQGVFDPFGLWQFEMEIAPMYGGMARAFTRLSASAAGGANCFRVPFVDSQEPSHEELGLTFPLGRDRRFCRWEGGQAWSNGLPWLSGKPVVPVTAASAKDSGTITLNISDWNGVLPTFFGIVGHFAVYAITGVTSEVGDEVTVRVWPPVRKAITTSDYATLRPVLACRLSSGNGAPWTMKREIVDGAKLLVTEVPDEVVRAYVTED
jgi:hypothetical protein